MRAAADLDGIALRPSDIVVSPRGGPRRGRLEAPTSTSAPARCVLFSGMARAAATPPRLRSVRGLATARVQSAASAHLLYHRRARVAAPRGALHASAALSISTAAGILLAGGVGARSAGLPRHRDPTKSVPRPARRLPGPRLAQRAARARRRLRRRRRYRGRSKIDASRGAGRAPSAPAVKRLRHRAAFTRRPF